MMRIAFVHPRCLLMEWVGATHSAPQNVSGLADAGRAVTIRHIL